MTSRSIEDLHPLLAYAFGKAESEYLLRYPEAPKPILTCTYRDKAEQLALYNQATDKKDNDGDGKIDESDERVTNAKPGESPHNYLPAPAFDVAFADKYSGITWGGNFKSLLDLPHFELTDWKKRVGKK